MKSKYFMENMTSPEINSAMKDGKDNVLLMIGAMEQHGPHLPINTDTLSAYCLAENLIKQLNNFLVAPIQNLGYSEHHMSFKGTITLSNETLYNVVKDSCNSLKRHGFKNIVIITTHGGNIPILSEKLHLLKEEIYENIHFLLIDNYDEKVDFVVKKILKDKVKNHEIHSCHACLHETSMMMRYFNEDIRKDKIVQGRIKSFDKVKLLDGGDLKEISPNGILGDPLLASSEIGEILMKTIVKENIKLLSSLNLD